MKEIVEEKLKRLEWPRYTQIDSHIHYVDFTQKSSGLRWLLEQMDKYNIQKSVIFWIPTIKQWSEFERERPMYYLSDDSKCYYYSNTDHLLARDYLSLSKEEQERFSCLICGFNPMDLNSIEYIKDMFQMYPWVFSWIWEIFFRHDDLTHLTLWEIPRLNTKWGRSLFELASKEDLPILVHQNLTSAAIDEFPKYLPELEEILLEFSKCKIVLAHAGLSRKLSAPYYHHMIERLLSSYENLYIDLSWVIFDDLITKSEITFNAWAQLIEKHSNRFMLWSDILWTSFHKVWIQLQKYDRLLDCLSKEAVENITVKNAEEVYFSNKFSLLDKSIH